MPEIQHYKGRFKSVLLEFAKLSRGDETQTKKTPAISQ